MVLINLGFMLNLNMFYTCKFNGYPRKNAFHYKKRMQKQRGQILPSKIKRE